MGQCEFCNNLKEWQEVDKEKRNVYKVRLVIADIKERGTINCRRGPLKYCPECGKELYRE